MNLKSEFATKNKITYNKSEVEQWIANLSILMASVRRSFSSQVSLSSAMIFSVSWHLKKAAAIKVSSHFKIKWGEEGVIYILVSKSHEKPKTNNEVLSVR